MRGMGGEQHRDASLNKQLLLVQEKSGRSKYPNYIAAYHALVRDKVRARNEGLSSTSNQTDIAPEFSMFCALVTHFTLTF
jgi:hypothetical protein